jgi:hypothetical protein
MVLLPFWLYHYGSGSIEKKAFFIPTPGQYEQEYLAEKFKLKDWCRHTN